MTVEFAYINILFVQLSLLSSLFAPEISFVDEWLMARAKQSGLVYSTQPGKRVLILLFTPFWKNSCCANNEKE